MEFLTTLEKKVCDLVNLVKDLKLENSKLVTENKELQEKIDELETSLLRDRDEQKERGEKIELTKLVVDGLLETINTIVEDEPQQ